MIQCVENTLSSPVASKRGNIPEIYLMALFIILEKLHFSPKSTISTNLSF